MSKIIEDKKIVLREELDKLKHEYKVELPKAIATARAFGDLKENAEYHAARERQSFVQARISQVTEQINVLNSIDLGKISKDSIDYGSNVTVIDKNSDNRIEFNFVSSNEVDPSEGKISLSSPIGSALKNRKVGEEVEIQIPAGKKTYYIEKIITIHDAEHKKKK